MRACDSLCVYYYNLTFLRFHFSLHLIVLSLILKIKWTNKRALTAHNAVYIVFRLPNVRHLINEFSVNWITRKRTHTHEIYSRESRKFSIYCLLFANRKKNPHTYMSYKLNQAEGIFERKFNLQTEFHFHNKRTGVLCMARKSNEKKSHAIVCPLCRYINVLVSRWMSACVFDCEFLDRFLHSLSFTTKTIFKTIFWILI